MTPTFAAEKLSTFPAPKEPSTRRTPAPAKPLKSDKAIEADLRRRLQRSKLAPDPISFTVKEGVVNWSGAVAVPQRKGAATRMAKAAGAARVINQIRTKAAPAAAPNPATRTAPREVRVAVAPAK